MKVLKFGAKWCPGCPIMKPRWKKIEEERLPTFIFLDKDANEFHRMHGEHSEEELAKFVDENKDK